MSTQVTMPHDSHTF